MTRRNFLKAISLNIAALALLLCGPASIASPPAEYDIVVYGGTSAGVIAAVQAIRMGKSAIDSDLQTMWTFESHVAERVFEELVAEYNIPAHRDHGVRMNGVQIESITKLSEQSRMQTTLQLICKYIKQLRWR